MKNLLSTCIAIMAMLALASSLFATDNYSKDSNDATKSMTGTNQVMSPAELEGMKVVSKNGDDIGKIDKVTTDPQSGQIKFVTISKGSVLGMGGKDVAVPREAFRIDETKQQATLTVNEDKLENVPQQASMSDDEYQQNLEQHYGVSPAWKENSQQMETEPSATKPYEGQ